MNKPDLLFVTPSLPSPFGTGSMLRAAMTLEALQHRFRVHVLNLNVWTWGPGKLSFVLQHAAAYAAVNGRGDIDNSMLADKYFPGIDFAAIHTFKLVMARVTVGIATAIRPAQPYLVLDLDDDECARSAGMLRLMEQENDLEAVRRARADEAQLRMLERMMAPRFNALCLAGVDDCPVLARRYPGLAVHHLPNAIHLPDDTANTSVEKAGAGVANRTDAPATLLFVGALYYAPNADGICFFAEHVLPLIQQRLGARVHLQIVGADPALRVSQLARNPSITVHPNVPSLAPFYAAADLCIVPLRAGSGTRIKILEAFSFRRPVVSTRLGAEGLAVEDGQQLLLADDPEKMAEACIALLRDQALRERIVDAAQAWVLEHHSIANVQAAMDAIYQPVLAQEGTRKEPCSRN